MGTRTLLSVCATTALTLVGASASAQSGPGGWQYTIAPYMVAAGMDGSIGIAGSEAEVDVPFSTILDNLDLAGMVHFDMMNERWVISSDLIFMNLEDDEAVAGGTTTATMEETLFEVAGGYRVSPAVILLAGARWVDLSTGLDFSGPNAGVGEDASKSWVDPFVGIQVAAPLATRWWLGLHGDVGGFGVGSDLAWHAYADIGYRASDLVSIILGYRAIDMDYEDGEGGNRFAYDVLTAGPQLGVAFRF
jgi:hypothetical protein